MAAPDAILWSCLSLTDCIVLLLTIFIVSFNTPRVGCTPPNLEYFSFRSYLFDTIHPQFGNLFASLGESANNLAFNTSGGPTSPGNLNRTTALITTGDLATAAYMQSQLVEVGFPSSAINFDFIPPSLVHMGRDTVVHDTFVMLNRVSIFADETQKERYTQSKWPIYMLYAPSSTAKLPYPAPVRQTKGTGTNEQAFKQGLATLQSDVSR